MTAAVPTGTTAAPVVPISRPLHVPEIEDLVLEVLRSGRLAQGPMVERFEAACAAMAGTAHAVAMANGTVTLEAIIAALGIGPGDEVITTPFTFVATANAILASGASVRFADIDPRTFTVDPAAVEALVGPRTVAVMPVHLYGQCADMDPLLGIAARHGLAVIEDAAQAHGAAYLGRRAGSFGPASFSFYATKNVSCGEGGAVTTDDADLARRLRLLRNQGMQERYRYEVVGRNLRMTEMQAAIGIPALARLDEANRLRAANAARYDEAIASSGALQAPHVAPGRDHVWHQYTVLAADADHRVALQAHLDAAGISWGRYYPEVLYRIGVYADDARVGHDRCPAAEWVVERCISVPVHDQLRDDERARVADALAAFAGAGDGAAIAPGSAR